MQYCNECGNKLQPDAAFCNECGTPVGETKSNQQEAVPVTTPAVSKPMTKKTKITLLTSAAVIVLLVVAHLITTSVMSKDRLIDKFESALLDKDNKQVASMLSSEDKTLDINEDSIAGMMRYLNENPDQVQSVIQDLKYQSSWYEKNEDADSFDILGLLSGNLVNLEKDGKFLFYDKYKLTVPSVYLSIYTNYKDTVLYVDGVEVDKADSPDYEATVGPFLPGYHTIRASFENEYIELSQEQEKFLSGYSSKESLSLYLEADEVHFRFPNTSDFAGPVKLFINGKDTGVDIIENPTFGPLLVDGTLTYSVEAQLPWGTVKTEERPIESSRVDVEYLTAEIGEAVMESVHKFEQEYAVAYTSVDTSSMTTASEAILTEIQNDAQNNQEYKRASRLEYLSSTFDVDSITLHYSDDAWYASLNYENFWRTDRGYFGPSDELSETSDKEYVELRYDNGNWLVSYQSSLWGFNASNPKEYKVENPELLTAAWVSADGDGSDSEEAADEEGNAEEGSEEEESGDGE